MTAVSELCASCPGLKVRLLPRVIGRNRIVGDKQVQADALQRADEIGRGTDAPCRIIGEQVLVRVLDEQAGEIRPGVL